MAILALCAIHGGFAQEALPLGWHSTDIGAQDIPGTTSYDPEVHLFTLEGTGDQIFRPDNLHFAYTVQTGNFEIITLVSYVYGMSQMGYGVNPAEEAGIMIREDLSPFANTYYLSVVGGDKGGIRYYVRNNDDLDKMRHPGENASAMLVPTWLKLKRIGNSFDSYFSQDGVNWIYSPDANVSIDMNPTCYVGLWCRGNANYVELFGWENPNNESILSMTAEFEATRIEEIENIYSVQNPISAHFVSIKKDTSYINVSNVFGRLESDEINYGASTSNFRICRINTMEASDSIFVRPQGLGSCTMTLTGDVSSFNLVNKFPVFVWESPQGWESDDAGTAGTSGFILREGDLYTIGGSANAALPVLSEGFHYMYREMEGDAMLEARISEAAFATEGALGGISFIADSSHLESAMARLVYAGDGMARFESRNMGADTVIAEAVAPVSLPVWIRMERAGTLLKASVSQDGEVWTQLGTDLDLDLGSAYHGGLMAGSSDNDNLSALLFEDVVLTHTAAEVNNLVPEQRMVEGDDRAIDITEVFGQAGTITAESSDEDVVGAEVAAGILTLTAETSGEAVVSLMMEMDTVEIVTDFTVTVTEPMEDDWIFEDIGTMLHNGYGANQGDGAYSISTFGDRIAGPADNFSFLHKERSGAQRIEAYVETIEDRGAASQAGIMFRESTDPGSLYLMYTVTAYEGIKLQYRWDDHSEPVVEIKDPDIAPPCWLRITRDEYNYFTAAYSLDGATWIRHGEFSIPLELPETSLVGLAATSGFNEGTSWFENVDISQVTGLDGSMDALPFRVDHFPNPFSESTTLRIHVKEQMDMQIKLYNMAGMEVAELMNESVNPGQHQIMLNAAGLVSGTYYYRVITPGHIITNKLLKIK